MLHAFKAHKIRDGIRNELWNSEDAKTSSIIGTLSHLPARLFWSILYNAVTVKTGLTTPNEIHEMVQIEFWPHWKLEHKVEPDVFIQFDSFDLILELKRNDDNKQYREQWLNEITAYKKAYSDTEKKFCLIAISGKTEVTDDNVYSCSWTALLNATVKCKETLSLLHPHSHEVRILEDAVKAFYIHREYAYRYFDSIDYTPEKYSISEHNDLFKTLK